MAEQNHFDAPRITSTVDALLKRYEGMSEPAARRKRALEESRKWHQLAFDVDCELQWIAEKVRNFGLFLFLAMSQYENCRSPLHRLKRLAEI